MNPELRDLYQDVILSHSKRPHNFGKLEDATQTSHGYNPLCGDNIRVFVKRVGDRLESVTFEGTGCAISTASASIMTDMMRGLTVAEAETLVEEFKSLVTAGTVADSFEDSDASALAGVHEYPVRIKCATLAWNAIAAAIHGKNETTTE